MSFKIVQLLLFIGLVWFSTTIIVNGQYIGQSQISNDILIESPSVHVNYEFVVDPTIQQPKLMYHLTKGNIEFAQIVNQISNSHIVIGEADPDLISSSSRLVHYSIFTILLNGLFLGMLTFNGSKLNKSLFFGIVVCMIASSVYAAQFDGIELTVTINMPANFSFSKVEIQSQKGSINLNGLISDSLVINNCKTTQDLLPITLNGILVNSLNVCSRSSVDVNQLMLKSSSSTIDVESDGDVNVEFQYPLSGQLRVETDKSTQPTIIGCGTPSTSVVGNNTVSTGTCGSSSTSNNVKVVGLSSARVVATSPYQCSISPTWRDPAQPLAGPVSPAISANAPATVTKFSGFDQWQFQRDWASPLTTFSPSSGSVNGVDMTGSFNMSIMGPEMFWLITYRNDIYMRKNRAYSFDLSYLSQVAPVAGTSGLVNVSVCVFNSYEINENLWLPDDPVELVGCSAFPGPWTATNSFGQKTTTYTPANDIPHASFAIKVYYKPHWTDPLTYQNFYFKDFTYTVPSVPVVTPTLLTSDSELITIPKPPTQTVQSQTNCPHLQTDLQHWHDPATWPNNMVPQPSSNIIIPNNTKILISSCSLIKDAVYVYIYVPPSSQLIFSDANMTIHVQDIRVDGQLWAGSSTCRLNARNLEFVFHGDKTTADTIAPRMGSKGIAVSKTGYISIQGKLYQNTWSRLAATAYPDDYVIYLQDAVNWEPQQQVVITTSRYEDEWYPENEVLTILAVQGKVVQFTTPLKFYHYGGQEYQAEVGLLSRRIIMRGDEASSTPGSFGGHVLTMSSGQFAGIELIRMGQKNMRARYPLHFHLAGHVTNSYVSDCSIHQSYYRCVTIHGTHDLKVDRNVAFDVTGHCYYIEDGIEENNTIAYNLAAHVHTILRPAEGDTQQGEYFTESDDLRQPADTAAAGFYITNAYNRIIGNAASGGWASYSFPNLPNTIGAYKDTVFNPSSRPNLEFNGNTAHSAGYFFGFGSCIYCGGKLNYSISDPTLLLYKSGRDSRETILPDGTPVPMVYTNSKAYLCSDGVGHWGDRIEVNLYESHDNHRSGTVFGQAWLNNAIINGNSGNNVRSLDNKQGFQFYDTWTSTIITNTNFRNYFHDPTMNISTTNPQDDNKVLVSMTHSDVFKPQGISATKNISFTNVPTSQIIGHNMQETGASRYYNFVDWDGSFVLQSTPQIIGSHLTWWQYSSSCQYGNLWNVWYCPKGNYEIGNFDLLIPGVIVYDDVQPATSIIGNSTLFGPGIPTANNGAPRRSAFITRNYGITGVTDMGWYLYLNDGSPANFEIATRHIPYGHFIMLAMRFPATTTFTIGTWYEWPNPHSTLTLSSVTTFTEVLNGAGDKYYFDGTHLYVKIVNRMLTGDMTEEAYTRDGVSIYQIYTGFSYKFTANCPSGNCKTTDVFPTKWT